MVFLFSLHHSTKSQSKNALVESPTGTGKTQCLLCAVLAWRQLLIDYHRLEKGLSYGRLPEGMTESAAQEKLVQLGQAIDPLGKGILKRDPPKVYYATRTHSQLSQVVKELKRTVYSVRVKLLASREQMCVNENVLQAAKGMSIGSLCKVKVSRKECSFYGQTEGKPLFW